ncbi:MAG: hypothetical protein HYX92_12400 [Chloroflexi bacterium]|nr:hypothetical protein [Chloroflexota bacterium]
MSCLNAWRWLAPPLLRLHARLDGRHTYPAQLFSAVTGIDRTEAQMFEQVGERGFNLERAILAREGRRREHDVAWNDYYMKLFSSWVDRDLLNQVMDDYYLARGWDVKTGIPTQEKLQQLDLGDVAEELKGRGIGA